MADASPAGMPPILSYGRPLVPGTDVIVPCEAAPALPGDPVIVAFRRGDGPETTVGTVGRVLSVRAASFGATLVGVSGDALVRLEPAGTRVDAGVGPAPDLIVEVERLLRRYAAAGVEAGEKGNLSIVLPRDPVAASHRVASSLRISWPEIQEILEAGDAIDRLRLEAMILQRETRLLRAFMGGRGSPPEGTWHLPNSFPN